MQAILDPPGARGLFSIAARVLRARSALGSGGDSARVPSRPVLAVALVLFAVAVQGPEVAELARAARSEPEPACAPARSSASIQSASRSSRSEETRPGVRAASSDRDAVPPARAPGTAVRIPTLVARTRSARKSTAGFLVDTGVLPGHPAASSEFLDLSTTLQPGLVSLADDGAGALSTGNVANDLAVWPAPRASTGLSNHAARSSLVSHLP